MSASLYNPADWYWVVGGSTEQVWASASAAYVSVTDSEYEAWLAAGNQPTAIESVADLADVLLAQYPAGSPVKSTKLTPLEFIGRFTADEQSAVTTASLASAPLLLWLVQAMGAQYIDLTDSRTKTGLDALVATGLLTVERETAILTP